MSNERAIVIGGGPAGLTAAWELLDRTSVQPIVIEAAAELGGISKTVEYRGNRIDIGGHRFFSKSDRVMNWWLNILPLQGAPARDDAPQERTLEWGGEARRRLPGERTVTSGPAPDPEHDDEVMLRRRRLSRIYFGRRFYDYPISLSLETLANLGPARVLRIMTSYLATRARPARRERSLEDFFINRFGSELYKTFFRDYTQKVWGVPCGAIKPEWGAQRIKGLSVSRAVGNALAKPFRRAGDLRQKGVETSLIDRFLYPKFGPGQMWETVGRQVAARGGSIHRGRQVVAVNSRGRRIESVLMRDTETGEAKSLTGEWFFSTMPIADLIAAMGAAAPPNVREVAAGLIYRDFMTVGLLLRRMKAQRSNGPRSVNGRVPDNWIYIQENDVRIGRLQIFNNWSPYLVKDPDTVWLGLEYFCNEGDALWALGNTQFARMAAEELAAINLIDLDDVLDAVVIRMPKTYPAYFGTYERLNEVRDWMDGFENLFLIGRNGMHRYNNQDHSMLTAMAAVDSIVAGRIEKDDIWTVNVEEDYHEERSA